MECFFLCSVGKWKLDSDIFTRAKQFINKQVSGDTRHNTGNWMRLRYSCLKRQYCYYVKQCHSDPINSQSLCKVIFYYIGGNQKQLI